MRLLRFAALAGLGILLILCGLGIPALIQDGTSELSGVALRAAREAIIYAHVGCLDHPVARFAVRRLRVVALEVDTESSAPAQRELHSAAGTPSPSNVNRQRLALEPGPPRIRYSARVRAYSFFGMPIGVVSINEDEILCRSFGAAPQGAAD